MSGKSELVGTIVWLQGKILPAISVVQRIELVAEESDTQGNTKQPIETSEQQAGLHLKEWVPDWNQVDLSLKPEK